MRLIHKIFANKVIGYAYLGWFAVALFYLYQYILRVFPGVMVDEIRSAFKITAEQFATFGSFTIIAYALLQIPLGILVDKVGVKKICIYSIIICILGTLLFANTETIWVAQVARIIIGAGSAASFLCALKFIADHVAPGKRGFLMGATLALGTCGAFLIGNSGKFIDKEFGWRNTLMLTAALGMLVLMLIILIVKNNKEDPYAVLNRKPLSKVFVDVLKIFRSKNIIIYAFLAVGLYTPLSALADLWGTAFIKQKYGLSKNDSAELVMVLYIGLTCGSMILPWLSEKLNVLNQAIIFCSFAVLIIFCIILYSPASNNMTSLLIQLFLLGFFAGGEMMCFTGALIESNKYDSGEIIGVVNTFNMLGGAIVQQLIGSSLDWQWNGVLDNENLRQYSTEQFQTSLLILAILVGICCFASLILLNIKPNKSLNNKL